MLTTLRALRSLVLALWVGGLAFFAFAVAPVAFHVLPSTHEAGLVVSATIRALHWIGLIAAPVILVCTALLWLAERPHLRRSPIGGILLTLAMFAATAWSQFGILPAMERDRTRAGGIIEQADITSPARLHFEHLHHISEQVEGAILLCGIALIGLLSRQPEPRSIYNR